MSVVKSYKYKYNIYIASNWSRCKTAGSIPAHRRGGGVPGAAHREANSKRSRPISRILCATRGPCGPRVRDNHSSRPTVTGRLQLPTRRLGGPLHRLPIWDCSGWRLPRFTLRTGQTRREDSSLWPCSARCRGWLLATTLPCGVRTFLPSPVAGRAAVVCPASRAAV